MDFKSVSSNFCWDLNLGFSWSTVFQTSMDGGIVSLLVHWSALWSRAKHLLWSLTFSWEKLTYCWQGLHSCQAKMTSVWAVSHFGYKDMLLQTGWSEPLEEVDSPSFTDRYTVSQRYSCPSELRVWCGVSLTCYTSSCCDHQKYHTKIYRHTWCVVCSSSASRKHL